MKWGFVFSGLLGLCFLGPDLWAQKGRLPKRLIESGEEIARGVSASSSLPQAVVNAEEVTRRVVSQTESLRVASSAAVPEMTSFSLPEILFYGGRRYTPGRRTSWVPLPPEDEPLVQGLFRAYPKEDLDGHSFSGFVFSTSYKGREERFGVVVAHSASPEYTKSVLGRFFTARVLSGGRAVDIPAEVVQVSPPSMLDLALVKFRPEDEKLFTPFKLAEQEPAIGEVLQGLGYSHNQVAFVPGRELLKNTLVSLRTRMPFPRIDRAGLCGSPLLNDKHEVVAVHTGSSRFEARPTDDIGFATKASYLHALVKAYHNEEGRAVFPLMLGNEKVAELNVDEYVSAVRIINGTGETIFRRVVYQKFPYSSIMDALPYGRYVEMDISRVVWKDKFLSETRLNPRTVKYDLKRKKMVK